MMVSSPKLLIFFTPILLGCWGSFGTSVRDSRESPQTRLYHRKILTDRHWQKWKQFYEKQYSNWNTETTGYQAWKENFRQVTTHNGQEVRGETTYRKKLNIFSDLSATEFLSKMTKVFRRNRDNQDFDGVWIPNQEVPSLVDWRMVDGMNNRVRFQNYYAYGWLFASLELVQTQLFLKNQTNVILSPQELLDCFSEYGYFYGSVRDALSYIRIRGVSLESNYPLTFLKSKFCRKDRKPEDIGIQTIQRLTPGNEDNLKRAVATIGPVAVKIHVTENFATYFSGVFYDNTCLPWKPVNHAVLVVGYGTDEVNGDFWIIKNSWGVSWGENGYMKMARNTLFDCGITSSAFYIVLHPFTL